MCWGSGMDSKLIEMLEMTAAEVFGKAFFICVDKWEGLKTINTRLIGVTITFDGFHCGSVNLWAANELASMIALNITGADETTNALNVDAVKESVNIFTGNLLTNLFGEEPEFNLSTPEILPDHYSPLTHKTNSVWLLAEQNPLIVSLEIKS